MHAAVGLCAPFVIRLRGRIPRPARRPASPRTLADYLKNARRVAPDVRFWPAILRYLGYDPRPEPAAFGGRIRAAREAEGLSERELARKLGLAPDTLSPWAQGEMGPKYSRTWWLFERYLASAEGGSVSRRGRT